jgi:hypothetical protein
MRIEVDTGHLSAAAAEQQDVACALLEVAGRAATVGSNSSIAGAPDAQAALMAFSEHWTGSLRENAEAIGGIATNAAAAASTYVTCDTSAIPR